MRWHEQITNVSEQDPLVHRMKTSFVAKLEYLALHFRGGGVIDFFISTLANSTENKLRMLTRATYRIPI